MQNMVNVQNISISIFLLHHKMFSLRNCLAQEFCFGLLQVFAYIVLDLPYFSAISFRFMGILLTLKHCQRHNWPEGWVQHTTSSYIFLIKFHLQNLNQASTSTAAAFRLNSNFEIVTKPSFRILTKIQLHNLNQTSAAKYWLNFSVKISPELQFQNLDQILCSQSEQKFSFMNKPQLPNCNKLLPTRSLSSTSATVSTSTCFQFTHQGHINQVY